jgi:centromere-localized protein 2
MPPQEPTEHQILTSYLLHPSPLPTTLPYTSLLNLLPPKIRSNLTSEQSAEIKRLYRDLQFQRDITIDDARRRIENECYRSTALAARLGREIAVDEGRKRRKLEHDEDDGDEDFEMKAPDDDDEDAKDEDKAMMIDTAMHNGVPLSNTTPHTTSRSHHSSSSLLRAMDSASQNIQSEIDALEAEIEQLKKKCEERIWGLSDLRYGTFQGARSSEGTANGSSGVGGVEDEVFRALRDLTAKLKNGAAGG